MPLAGRFVWSVMPKLMEEEVRGKTVLVLLSAEFKLFRCRMSQVAGRYVANVPLAWITLQNHYSAR